MKERLEHETKIDRRRDRGWSVDLEPAAAAEAFDHLGQSHDATLGGVEQQPLPVGQLGHAQGRQCRVEHRQRAAQIVADLRGVIAADGGLRGAWAGLLPGSFREIVHVQANVPRWGVR
jgi:hypothetical protein